MIVSEIKTVKVDLPVTIDKMAILLDSMDYNIIRWSIIDVKDNLCTLNLSYTVEE